MYYDMSLQDATVSVVSGASSTKVSVSVVIVIIMDLQEVGGSCGDWMELA
jgi:hypothetical protein